MKKADFIKVINGIEDIDNFNITIWHENSEIYTEVLINDNEPFTYGEIENWYEGETIEDTKENITILLKSANKIKSNITKWIKGTCFEGTTITIQEQNI
jgi:hypothetical protein